MIQRVAAARLRCELFVPPFRLKHAAARALEEIGYSELNVGQLKIMQEVITLSVFVPFAMLYLKEPFKLDYVWAALCMVGAVYFMFRSA